MADEVCCSESFVSDKDIRRSYPYVVIKPPLLRNTIPRAQTSAFYLRAGFSGTPYLKGECESQGSRTINYVLNSTACAIFVVYRYCFR